jgi:uncharacterized protein
MLLMLSLSLTVSSCAVGKRQMTRRFSYRPKPLAPVKAAPSYWGFMDATLDTVMSADSSAQLLAWWIPSSRLPIRCGSALLLHGKGRNRAEMAPLARALSANGFDVLAPDYRGYGGSTGVPSDSGIVADAETMYAHMILRTGTNQMPRVILGHSLGTALAAQLAHLHQPGAAVFLAPFSTVGQAARARFGWVGVQVLDTTMFNFRPADDVRQLKAKVFVGIAGKDLLIPRRISDDFVKALPSPPTVLLDPNASHNGLLASEPVIRAVTDSVRAWLRCP